MFSEQLDEQTFTAASDKLRTASNKNKAIAVDFLTEVLFLVRDGEQRGDPKCTEIMNTARIKCGLKKEGLLS